MGQSDDCDPDGYDPLVWIKQAAGKGLDGFLGAQLKNGIVEYPADRDQFQWEELFFQALFPSVPPAIHQSIVSGSLDIGGIMARREDGG